MKEMTLIDMLKIKIQLFCTIRFTTDYYRFHTVDVQKFILQVFCHSRFNIVDTTSNLTLKGGVSAGQMSASSNKTEC